MRDDATLKIRLDRKPALGGKSVTPWTLLPRVRLLILMSRDGMSGLGDGRHAFFAIQPSGQSSQAKSADHHQGSKPRGSQQAKVSDDQPPAPGAGSDANVKRRDIPAFLIWTTESESPVRLAGHGRATGRPPFATFRTNRERWPLVLRNVSIDLKHLSLS
jgi:hypothetical protein